MNQALLDRIRIFNKYATNRILIHLCGRGFGHFAILSHTGRKSGKLYRIPIIAEPLGDGFVFALTYGKKVDWLENVMAKGGCALYWKRKDFQLVQPEFIEKETALKAFPRVIQAGLRQIGIQYYLKLAAQP